MGQGVVSSSYSSRSVRLIFTSINAEVKNDWSFTSTPPICLRVLCSDKLTFTELNERHTA